MLKIRIFSSFCESKICHTEYIRLYLHDDPDYGTKYIFTEEADFTHVIIWNTAMPNISHIPKDNVIGLAFEPPFGPPFLNLTSSFINYAIKFIGIYFIGDSSGLPSPFKTGYGYLTHESFPTEIVPWESRQKMSIMISSKLFAPGHKYRHRLVTKILQTNLPIDIYGNGCAYYKDIALSDSRIKGPFKSNDILCKNYQYTISIENFQTPAYFSEKIINPLIYDTVPIYIGCTTIQDFFPHIIKLTGNIDDDMKIITDICYSDTIPERHTQKYVKDMITIKNIINMFF